MKTIDKLQEAKSMPVFKTNQFLIDTNILLWAVAEPKKLSYQSIEIITNRENDIYVSLISFWEIAIKKSIGKLEFKSTISELEEIIISKDFKILNLDTQSIEIVQDLPFYQENNNTHKDPFDRLIISQAIRNEFSIISSDAKFNLYPEINKIW